MNDLVEFLAARYGEKETAALAARSATERAQTTGAAQTAVWTVEPYHLSEPGAFPTGIWVVTGPDGEEGVAVVNGSYRADHMALNDPAAALADVAMKRRILELHTGSHECSVMERGEIDGYHFVLESEACTTARLLGSEFSGHPDYQERWKA